MDDVKKYLIDNDIEINDEINVSIKNLTYNQENKFFNNRDYKIEKTKLIEL
ncbi:MAG: hypothetical protein MJ201_01530 [Mycoplasmoidaceae bacterium]|nr:hypothetical protein [Mycoplasmoidaceae bacterium]